MNGVMMMSTRPIPAPAEPTVSSRPYGPPDTERQRLPNDPLRQGLRATTD